MGGDEASAAPAVVAERAEHRDGTAPEPEPVLPAAAGSARPSGSLGSERCAVRDPEDGRCYPSADAADAAWLAKGGVLVKLPVPADEEVALEEASLPLEEDPDEEESEAVSEGHASAGEHATEEPTLERTANPARLAFWKNLARTVKGLVVRKKDSRAASLPEDELAALFETGFPLPIEAFPTAKLRDTFNAPRGRHRRHHAIDLPAPRGTPIVAVVDGTIERLGRDRRGGKVVYLRDASGKFIYYFAHLSRHAEGLSVGDEVVKGQKLGEVGTTGRVIGGPHLHFAIFRDSETPSPWKGLAINPYLVFSALLVK